MELKEKQLAFQILTPCTLNCRLCADYAPLYRKTGERYYVSLETFQREIDETFKIYDFIEDLTITGGEPLLHRQLAEIVEYTLKKHSSHFKTCRIFSNATLIPDERLLSVICNYSHNNFEFVLDCYGKLSDKTDAIVQLLKVKNIPCRVNQYYGAGQHCGGWVDYGPLDTFRNYPQEKVHEMISRCHNATWKNLLVFKGKLYLCTQAAFGFDLGYFHLKSNEYVDLLDQELPISRRKEIASSFGSMPTSACQYCNGFDVERSVRYPAGEQE